MHSKSKPVPVTANFTHSTNFQSLSQWLEWQEGLHFTAIELGLDRCMTVAENMDLLQPDFAVISVAGTNGKGSSVTMLDSILKHAGYKTGCYTSPHLIRYNERIKINSQEVIDPVLCETFERINLARGDISLTYFEFGTLAAFDIFKRAEIDIAILEVGLGGRLDAVNCLDADIALITSIDIDHENWLGSGRNMIAREKAGIMRASSPAVCSDPNPPESLLQYAEELGATLYLLNRDYHFNYLVNDEKWLLRTAKHEYADLPIPSLYNSVQVQNAAGVLMVLSAIVERFPVSIDSIQKGLREFKLSGRCQIVPDKAQCVLDVAHNPQSARVLVQNLQKFPICGKTHILIGMLKDKDRRSVFTELAEIADVWHVVPFDDPRSADCKTIIDEIISMKLSDEVMSYDSVAQAMDYIRNIVGPQDRIVVTGSFLTVGEAISYLNLQS